MHNSFDIEMTIDGFTAKSHNFHDLIGSGKTEAEAINDMDRKIKYYQDNDPQGYLRNVKNRIQSRLQCGCGLKLSQEDKVLSVVF